MLINKLNDGNLLKKKVSFGREKFERKVDLLVAKRDARFNDEVDLHLWLERETRRIDPEVVLQGDAGGYKVNGEKDATSFLTQGKCCFLALKWLFTSHGTTTTSVLVAAVVVLSIFYSINSKVKCGRKSVLKVTV